MDRRRVVTCFLERWDRILVLKRSSLVRTYRGKWAGVSGGIEAASPQEQAMTEIEEETGLRREDLSLLRQAEALDVDDPESGRRWRVYPFLFQVRGPAPVRLDWEHTESRWIPPSELDDLDTVPSLKDAWEQLWSS